MSDPQILDLDALPDDPVLGAPPRPLMPRTTTVAGLGAMPHAVERCGSVPPAVERFGTIPFSTFVAGAAPVKTTIGMGPVARLERPRPLVDTPTKTEPPEPDDDQHA